MSGNSRVVSAAPRSTADGVVSVSPVPGGRRQARRLQHPAAKVLDCTNGWESTLCVRRLALLTVTGFRDEPHS